MRWANQHEALLAKKKRERGENEQAKRGDQANVCACGLVYNADELQGVWKRCSVCPVWFCGWCSSGCGCDEAGMEDCMCPKMTTSMQRHKTRYPGQPARKRNKQ